MAPSFSPSNTSLLHRCLWGSTLPATPRLSSTLLDVLQQLPPPLTSSRCPLADAKTWTGHARPWLCLFPLPHKTHSPLPSTFPLCAAFIRDFVSFMRAHNLLIYYIFHWHFLHNLYKGNLYTFIFCSFIETYTDISQMTRVEFGKY